MDAESASTALLMNMSQKGQQFLQPRTYVVGFFHTEEEWSQIGWDQQVKSFLCMAGSCTALCGCKTFPYYQLYEEDRGGLCW